MLSTALFSSPATKTKALLTFIAITLFYFFEAVQIGYFNVLAPYFLSKAIYTQDQIAGLSSAYYYGNVIGLLPIGFALDRFPLRKILLWAIVGSVISAFLLVVSHNYTIEWLARFFCGFFGGTFSFVGGIMVLISLYPNKFSFYMGLFISAGMFAGLVCQYPLLYTVNQIGAHGAMISVAVFGLIVAAFNWLYLHPPIASPKPKESIPEPETLSTTQICLAIVKNVRNWLDCLMVILLDTPISIMGTLWGIVLIMNYYHFSDVTSAFLVTSLFAGLMIGSPLWGIIGDRCHYSASIIIIGAGMSFAMLMAMLLGQHWNAYGIATLAFGLGFFSSCQSLGFTWLTKNMRPELIGRNSSFNSMILMGSGGIFKQVGAWLLASSPLIAGKPTAVNLLIFMAAAMLIALCYAMVRKHIFKHLVC